MTTTTTPRDSREPRTEAGKALAAWIRTHGATPRPGITAAESIAAIEEQAAAEARRELLAKVDKLPPRSFVMEGPDDDDREWMVTKTAVRRLIEEASQ